MRRLMEEIILPDEAPSPTLLPALPPTLSSHVNRTFG
jgi:hypothetical protein